VRGSKGGILYFYIAGPHFHMETWKEIRVWASMDFGEGIFEIGEEK